MILESERHGREVDLITRERPLATGLIHRFSDHLAYAVSAFSAYSLLAGYFGDNPTNLAPRRSDDWWKGQALLTSYLVISRELDSFLYPEISAHLVSDDGNRLPRPTIDFDDRKNRSTITSFDFVRDQAEWIETRPPRPTELRDFRSQINRWVVHFDLSRTDSLPEANHDPPPKKRVWDVSALSNLLQPALLALSENLDTSLMSEASLSDFQSALRGEATDLKSLSTYPFFQDLQGTEEK